MAELETVREMNALTIMPLPVRIPASWYDLLPKVLPLINRPAEKTKYCMPEETVRIFVLRWNQALIRREDAFVWLHLGGVACYEIIPDFVRGVKEKIAARDKEIKQIGGAKAVIQHWRSSIEELKPLNDDAVLKARNEMLRSLHPDMWHEGLSRAWSFAAERAHMNFDRIRPAVQRWIASYEDRCDLDKPFSGRVSESITSAMNRPSSLSPRSKA